MEVPCLEKMGVAVLRSTSIGAIIEDVAAGLQGPERGRV